MSSYDDIHAAANTAEDQYNKVVADNTALKQQVTTLEAEVADLKKQLEETQPPKPPPTGKAELGGSYGGADESQYKGRAKVARIFFQKDVPADIPGSQYYAQAYKEGVRTFVISWKGTDLAVLEKGLKSLPTSGVKVYGCFFHEPEDNIPGTMSLASWKDNTTKQAALMKKYGVIPTTILMSWTLNPKSGRNVTDYYMKGVIECWGQDYYMNPAKGKEDPEGQMVKIANHAKASGAKTMLIGEIGVPHSVAENEAVDLIKRARAAILAEPICVNASYWSSGDFTLTPATGNAWFDGK